MGQHEDDPGQLEMPKPSPEDSNHWVLWHACWVETLAWWPELWRVPNQTDIPQFARQVQVWASFQMPKVRCHTKKMENDYSVLPTPQCIERDAFLPFSTMKCGVLDYHMKQPHKILVYAKALQFWVEKAQLPMPVGRVCTGIEGGHGASDNVYRQRSSWQ